MNQAEDKFEIHYRQQLSALIDGDLAPDEARFLLRRLQHDGELNDCWERWQLCGDALRGQAQAPAPAGFADRVAAAIAAETGSTGASVATAPVPARSRSLLAKWGGGALAASVALVALFMARQNVPTEVPGADMVASQQQVTPAKAVEPEASDAMAAAPVASAVVAAVAVSRKAASGTSNNRGSATRNQQVARANARRAVPQARAAGTVAASVAAAPQLAKLDPFRPTHALGAEPVARPWPKSGLSEYPSASGAFNASFGSERSRPSFHPFEPQLQQTPPIPVPVLPQN